MLSSIHRIELPLPFELSTINLYLVPLDCGYLLIDCGMDTEESFAALKQDLSAAGIGWSNIKQILLTHMHPDHVGLSARLLQLTGAHLSMHALDVQLLEIVSTPERRAAWIGRAFEESGVPETLQAKMQEHFRAIRGNFHPLNPDRLLSGGEEILTSIGPLRVIWTPGHSPGHVCLYSAEHRLLFSGDQILPNITPNISWIPEQDTLGDYLQSLEALKPLEIDTILPAHGEPFSGHAAWIEATIRHHRHRCNEIEAILLEAPRTAQSLVLELWRKQLSPINHQFAILEVLAHLKHMQRQGRVQQNERQWSACCAAAAE